MYPSYDVLKPGTEVTINPFGFVLFDPTAGFYIVSWDESFEPEAGVSYFVINAAYMLHYSELRDEVKNSGS